MLKIIQLISSPIKFLWNHFGMKNSINQLLICGPLCKITFNIPQLVKNANCTSCEEVFNFFLTCKQKSEMHQKCIRNTYSPLDQFLNIFCFLHIHPQLLHLILNSHISAPPTHPKIIKFVKCKWLPNKID